MKTEKFGPYEFVIVESHIRVNQRRTFRDYANMLINLAIILLLSAILYFAVTYLLPQEKELSDLLIFGFFIIASSILIYISTKRLLKILFVPLRDLIHIDKKKEVLNFRIQGSKDGQLPLDELFCLEYGYVSSSINPLFKDPPGHSSPLAAIVYARSKEKKRYPILLIREPNFQYWSNPGLLDITQPFVERLGTLLNIRTKFHRKIDIDRYENHAL